MSCKCGGNCDCGSSCNCGRNPSLGFSEEAAAASITVTAIIAGVAPVKMYGGEMLEKSAEGGHGCKCGSSCSCDPCNC